MSSERDFYDELGVTRSATADEIRTAYRQLAREYHPDLNDSADAAERFAAISEAYEVLSNDEKRSRYDRFGRAGLQGVDDGNGAGGFGHADLDSLFREMFGSAGPGGASPFTDFRSASPRPRRGGDLRHGLTVSFLTAALGGSESFRLTRDGAGEAETISVRIPAGIESGATMRVSGRGSPGQNGGPPGDMLLEIEVGAHPWFRRDGLDITVEIPVTIAEAALGATVDVPLLTGTAELRVPPGADSGRRLRLRGHGITDPEGRTGDLYAEIRVVAPKELTEETRAMLEALAPELKNPRESGPWAPQRTARSG